MTEDDIKLAYFDDTIFGTTPNGTPVLKEGDKAIYGLQDGDDRKDLYELAGSAEGRARMHLAAATVLLTSRERLEKREDGSWKLDVSAFKQSSLPPCSGEKFSHQMTGGWCSGFMVGEDVIVTAGHCGNSQSKIVATAYIFGFQSQSETDPGTEIFSDEQVYFGKKLLSSEHSSKGDFAIVQLDRKITAPGAEALTLRSEGFAKPGDRLGVIGYPSGLPVKVAYGEDTTMKSESGPWLIANLDTFGGNSGSAVFNTKGEVEGILVRGKADYKVDDTCFRAVKYSNSEGSEAVTLTKVFRDKIPV